MSHEVNGEEILRVQNLTVRLGHSEVLRELTFAVRRGSVLAILGPNGAGKTILLKSLIGAVPHTGTIRWANDARLGYVPQKLDIERDLPISGRDFLSAKASLVGVPKSAIPRALESVGLEQAQLATPIGHFSGGQFQRLLVAFALLGDPTVLLLDEPAAGIDEPGQARLEQVIRRLQSDQRLTVVLVSHELSVVYRDADQVLCLGRQHMYIGPPRTALTPETLQAIYGVPVSFHVHDSI